MNHINHIESAGDQIKNALMSLPSAFGHVARVKRNHMYLVLFGWCMHLYTWFRIVYGDCVVLELYVHVEIMVMKSCYKCFYLLVTKAWIDTKEEDEEYLQYEYFAKQKYKLIRIKLSLNKLD